MTSAPIWNCPHYHTRFSMRKTISKNDPLFPQRKDIALLLNIFIGSSGWRSQPPNLRHQSGGTLGKLTLPRNIFGSCLSISGRICSCTISLGVAGGVTKRTGANFARNEVRKVRWGWRFLETKQLTLRGREVKTFEWSGFCPPFPVLDELFINSVLLLKRHC